MKIFCDDFFTQKTYAPFQKKTKNINITLYKRNSKLENQNCQKTTRSVLLF